MKIHQITFSPTGGTRHVCDIISDGLIQSGMTDEQCQKVELCVGEKDLDFPIIDKHDLVLLAFPVFAGRVPALALERMKRIVSHGALCVVIVVYGNRAFDDALLELQDAAAAIGFRVIASVGAVAEHSIIRKYGQGRPDLEDTKLLKGFAEQITQKVVSGNCSIPLVPGNRPYKKPMNGPHPTASKDCTACGLCVNECPTGAISSDNILKVDSKICISCMKCISVCPTHARGIGSLMNFLLALAIKNACKSRKQNELFI